MAQIQSGKLFGEIGLNDEGSKRTATCVACGRTMVAIIEKEFWSLIEKDNSNTSLVAKDIRTLQLTDGFKTIKKGTLIKIYDNSEKITIPSEVVVFRQGDFLEHIYIILSGKLMVAKDFTLNDKKKRTLEIDRLEVGDKIGDYCFIFKEKIPYSVVTLYPVRVLKIPLDEIKTRLTDDDLMEMVNHVKLYPKDDDIVRIYEEKRRWKKYTEDVTCDVRNAKKLEKYDNFNTF